MDTKFKNKVCLELIFQKKKFFYFSSPQYRICDYCNEKQSKEPPIPTDTVQSVILNNQGTTDDVDVSFEVRPERLQPTTDT